MKILYCFILSSFLTFAAEHNPLHYEIYDDVVNSVLKLSSASMGGFFDAMKSYIVYTSQQNMPGGKESGVGYYYDNKTREMKKSIILPNVTRVWA